MKIKGWIIYSFLVLLAVSSRALCAEQTPVIDTVDQLEQSVKLLKASSSDSHGNTPWEELKNFQEALWRAMALDPTPYNIVPVSEVPKELFAAEITQALDQQFAALKTSNHLKDDRVQFEFDQYAKVVEGILNFRHARQFPQSRGIAKRGTLDEKYDSLLKKLSTHSVSTTTQTNGTDIAQIGTLFQTLKEQVRVQSKDIQKKDVFANGNQFIWYAIVAIFGFFMGIAGYRFNPDFFQKILEQVDSTAAPTATTHPAGASTLDYARWLKEFEEILSRLKSSQLTHERRIEDISINSGKITQHALSLYSDPRIKNEANLEYRMSTLLREIQHQYEQSQKLKAGDRVQMNMMLEHCLMLCDGIENSAIVLDKSKVAS